MISVTNSRKRGFSLLELLVAIAILSVGIIVILQALAFCAKASGIASGKIRAFLVAEDRLQELQYQDKHPATPQMYASGAQNQFRWDYALEPVLGLSLYKCTVNLFWQTAARNEKLSLNTYLKK